MQPNEMLAEWAEGLARGMREALAPLTPEQMAWQPAPETNSMGVTVWHCSRWFDLLVVRAFSNLPAEAEQWHTRGWALRTGYDPRGHGTRGFGNVTGYTWEEVLAIPNLSAADQLAYLDETTTALVGWLRAMSPDALFEPVPGLGGKRTAYQWEAPVLRGALGHLGEIEALKTIQARGA